MKLASYDFNGRSGIGVQLGEEIIDVILTSEELRRHELEFPALQGVSDMISLLDRGDLALNEARELLHETTQIINQGKDRFLREIGAILSANQVHLRSPVPRPRKNILCVGLNYRDHWLETAARRGEPLPSFPMFFSKSVAAVIGPFDDIVYPSSSDELDYEVELAVILGRRGKDIQRKEAFEYVAGYAILNDVSARDLHRKHQQLFKGKSLDTFAPLGPCIVTKDEISDPHSLDMELKVNGELRQRSNTREMIFRIPDIVEILSQDMTLEPGDVIGTGTPAGVALGMTHPRYLAVGDVVEARIEDLGSIQNKVVQKTQPS
jgi:2-keto-4-pentenoate hydratase/2-oxohepta-3-ene-1,7-dioic acid hydratase in catechol pathway